MITTSVHTLNVGLRGLMVPFEFIVIRTQYGNKYTLHSLTERNPSGLTEGENEKVVASILDHISILNTR